MGVERDYVVATVTYSAHRPYVQRERRLMGEYLAATYPHDRVITGFRLGPTPILAGGNVPPGVSERYLSSWLLRADAIVMVGPEWQVWEVKNVATGAAIGQVEEYAMLLLQSPEYLAQHGGLVSRHILAGGITPSAMQMATQRGINVTLYAPPWYYADAANLGANLAQYIVPRSAPVDVVGSHIAQGGVPSS